MRLPLKDPCPVVIFLRSLPVPASRLDRSPQHCLVYRCPGLQARLLQASRQHRGRKEDAVLFRLQRKRNALALCKLIRRVRLFCKDGFACLGRQPRRRSLLPRHVHLRECAPLLVLPAMPGVLASGGRCLVDDWSGTLETLRFCDRGWMQGDYMVTCPLLTLDLLWTLNLPYKFTYALFVFLTLFSGFISSGHPQPGYMCVYVYMCSLTR